jgi:hypothetical protein
MRGERAIKRLPAAFAGLVASLVLAAPAHAGDPIMPLSQVHSGMHCTGLSVIRGTTISSFDVDIIDVTEDGILFEASGPAVDQTGIGEGFSGSPIYCKDSQGVSRVVGAIAEGIGDYGNHKGLATPIEQMLAQPATPPGSPLAEKSKSARRAQPLLAPLTISGITPPMQQRVLAAARKAGRAVITDPPPAYAIFPPQTLRPGASLGVGLSSGDIAISAIGTVTYTDGPNVWGFGHPLDAFGARSLLLQDAYVYDVINNPVGTEGLTTYKYASPGHNLGTLSNDTISAVVGTVGELPPLIQMAVHIRDLDTGASKDTNAQITDELGLDLPPSLDLVGPIAIGDGAFNVLGSAPFEQSGTMCMSIKIRERSAPLRFCNRYAGAAVDRMIDDSSRAILLVDDYTVRKFHHLHVERVDATEGVARGLHQGLIVGASGPARVRPGQKIAVRLRLRLPHGPLHTLTIHPRVPRSLSPGLASMEVRGTSADGEPGGAIDEALGAAPSESGSSGGPKTLKQLAAKVAAIHRFHGVTVAFKPVGLKRVRAKVVRLFPSTSDPLLRISGKSSRRVAVR